MLPWHPCLSKVSGWNSLTKHTKKSVILAPTLTCLTPLSISCSLYNFFFPHDTHNCFANFLRIVPHNAAKSDSLTQLLSTPCENIFQKYCFSNPTVNLHLNVYLKFIPNQSISFQCCVLTGVCGWEVSLLSVPYSPDPRVKFIWRNDSRFPGLDSFDPFCYFAGFDLISQIELESWVWLRCCWLLRALGAVTLWWCEEAALRVRPWREGVNLRELSHEGLVQKSSLKRERSKPFCACEGTLSHCCKRVQLGSSEEDQGAVGNANLNTSYSALWWSLSGKGV